MFGISADAPVSMADYYAGLHPEDREKISEAFTAACDPTRRALYNVEYRTVGKEDGVVRWVAAKGRGLFDASGQCFRVVGTAVDITERKTAEQVSAAQAEELRAVFDAVPSAIWIARDPDCREIFGNSLANAALRMAAGTNMSKSASDNEAPRHFRVLDAEGGELAPDAMPVQRAARGEMVRGFEQRVEFTDGSSIDLLGNATPLRDADGRTWGAVGAFMDITERKRTEAALRASEERFRQLAETVEQVFYVTELDERRLSYLSPAFERVWRRSPDEVLADLSTFFDSIHPEDHAFVVAAERDQIAGRARELEYRIVRPDGEVRWIRDRFFPVHSGDGQVHRSVGLAEDITEAKRLQDELKQLNDTLETRVVKRTAELDQAQEALRQSQKLEAMGQLTGGVAHDFNNLLTPIIGGLDMLQRRGIGDDRARRQIDGALQSAERAKTLVQRLLAFARRQPLQTTAVDLKALIEGMADLIASTSGPQVKVAVDVAPDLPAARADANQVEMALLNLAVNSRDAMPDGGTLTIAAAQENVGAGHRSKLPPGSYVRLAVADTGSGMDDATLARAIEPFFSTKGVGQGTGLGLSMVHGLASQLQGALTIRSRVGLGTSVELWLPLASEPAQTSRVAPAEAVHGGAGTALLVDDEEVVRASTADMLIDLGYTVVEASSAERALGLIRDGLRPDVLITDHLMPGMTGTDLAYAAREHLTTLPVLIVSGYAEHKGLTAELPRLVKPFRQGDLATSLSEIGSAGRSG